jgi:hypothetical protein
MDDDSAGGSSPQISYKPTWQESPLFILDLIEQKDTVEMKNRGYEFWEQVYRNIEIFERAIMKCIELQDILVLDTVVSRLARPDHQMKKELLFYAHNWTQGKTFLEHLWQ